MIQGPSRSSRLGQLLPPFVLAAAVYLPLLFTAPGRVGADTKAYLYLSSGRLLARAPSMWDPSSGLGGLSHQTIGYLWPMGPWFWTLGHLGLPDWVAQRLWLGSILFAAGAGTLWLLRSVLGWRTAPAVVAAFSYACTPYVLSLAARISVILLPFAGLPFLIGLTIRSVRRGGWRDPAAFALVVATVGSVNATALALVGLGPLWWLVHARLSREATSRQLLGAVGRIAVLTVAVNLWWLTGLWAQSGFGIDILRYTETAEAVTTASNATELLRGLGYWFFYGSDRLGPWIEPAVDYTQRLPLMALSFALPTAALLAAGVVRFRERAFAVGLIAIGLVAAVGAHPFTQPPLTGRAVRAFLDTDVGLAMRSLPRAVPLLALGLAIGLGAGTEAATRALARYTPTRRVAAALPVVAAVLAYAALPPLWTGNMVAGNLDRPERLPGYWLEATRHLDQADDGTRVLEIPGAEFASYRWGNTVDAITPGLMDRPQAARELIPYGSPPSADLLSALDTRVQEGTLAPGALAAVARLLGAGDILLRNDLQYERYRTPRPYTIGPMLAAEPGLEPPVDFGAPVLNRPVPSAPLDDELGLSAGDDVPRPPLQVYGVTDPVPIVRTHPAEGGVVLAGDGTGLVHAAEAGFIRGDELVRYAASLDPTELRAALDAGAALVITDGNRLQGRRWSTVRDVLGAVEPPSSLRHDPGDNRLPIFPGLTDGWRTTAIESAVSVAATSYGNPISFTPEYRPANAADGNVATEWRTGADSDVVGERLELTVPAGSGASAVRLVQQLSGSRNRHITEIAVRIDDGERQRVTLDERSLTPAGQEVALQRTDDEDDDEDDDENDEDDDGARFHELSIEILADSTGRQSRWARPQRFVGLTQVGFAEVQLLGDATAPPPSVDHALELPAGATGAIDESAAVALVLSRWRTDPTDAVRQDPELAIARRWTQPVARTFTVEGTARLTPDALDPVVDATLGTAGPTVSSSTRLIGVAAARASAALDGDPATWWSPSFFDPVPFITAVSPAPTTIDRLRPVVFDDGVRSVASRLRIEADGGPPVEVDLPAAGEEVLLPAPVTGTSFRFTMVGIIERTSIDWFSQSEIVLPPAIAELGIPSLLAARPAAFDTGCRDDLLRLDDVAVPVRVQGTTAAALHGEPFAVVPCGPPLALPSGPHDLRAANGLSTGIDLDQLVLRSPAPGVAPAAGDGVQAPTVEVLQDDRWNLELRVTGAEPGTPFWLVLGQSHNLGWRLDGAEPQLVDGFANGWLVTPSDTGFDVTLTWTPQRVVNLGLAGSAAAAVACLAILVTAWVRRRRSTGSAARTGSQASASLHAGLPADAPLPVVGRRRRPVAALAITLGSALAIGPVSALVVGAGGLAAIRWRGARRLLGLAPAAAYALAASYVLARQVVSKPSPAFEWPAEQAAAHQPAMVAIALLVLVVALGPDPAPETDPDPETVIVPAGDDPG